jgi:hypothetical protein
MQIIEVLGQTGVSTPNLTHGERPELYRESFRFETMLCISILFVARLMREAR